MPVPPRASLWLALALSCCAIGACRDAGEPVEIGEPPGAAEPVKATEPVAAGEPLRRRMRREANGRRAHVGLPPNNPCGRHSSSRIVSAKMNMVPPLGR